MAGVRADLDRLKAMLSLTGSREDAVLGLCLEAAGNWVIDRVMPASLNRAEVVEATLLLASRLYKRRLSPEGVAGWDDMAAIRILSRDPDVERLLEQHVDVAKVLGVA